MTFSNALLTSSGTSAQTNGAPESTAPAARPEYPSVFSAPSGIDLTDPIMRNIMSIGRMTPMMGMGFGMYGGNGYSLPSNIPQLDEHEVVTDLTIARNGTARPGMMGTAHTGDAGMDSAIAETVSSSERIGQSYQFRNSESSAREIMNDLNPSNPFERIQRFFGFVPNYDRVKNTLNRLASDPNKGPERIAALEHRYKELTGHTLRADAQSWTDNFIGGHGENEITRILDRTSCAVDPKLAAEAIADGTTGRAWYQSVSSGSVNTIMRNPNIAHLVQTSNYIDLTAALKHKWPFSVDNKEELLNIVTNMNINGQGVEEATNRRQQRVHTVNQEQLADSEAQEDGRLGLNMELDSARREWGMYEPLFRQTMPVL